ncbi:hypothetical protein ACJJTC_018646 [Scirpophaga incertulas]
MLKVLTDGTPAILTARNSLRSIFLRSRQTTLTAPCLLPSNVYRSKYGKLVVCKIIKLEKQQISTLEDHKYVNTVHSSEKAGPSKPAEQPVHQRAARRRRETVSCLDTLFPTLIITTLRDSH